MDQRKADASIGHYNANLDELLVALASYDFLEPITSIEFTDNTSETQGMYNTTVVQGTKIHIVNNITLD